MKLNGKVVLVTGASSGIGEATVAALVKEGAKVAAVARRQDRLDALVKRLAGGPGEVLPIKADIAEESQARDAAARTEKKWGRIDVLVANAGVMLLGPVYQANTEDWRRMVNVNILGVLYCTHAVLPVMIRQKEGHLVNISSVAGRVVFAQSAVYCATKYAVRAFSETLRKEIYQDNIRVTVIEPGAVATELATHITNAGAKEMIEQLVSAMKPLESEDIAAAILYALTQPPHVDVNEILIRPTQQEL
ncbi:MAG: oxidoreductase [Pedosphaera sp.]|nr:oxidoreductase [Pedosphaera sp.]